MAKGVNKVILIGHLGQDPDVKFMPSGVAVANVSIATTESWKDKTSGEKVEKTEWHKVVFFGKLAEIVGEYLRKGSQIYVEGRLQTDKYQKDGTDRYSTKIIANNMQMLGGKGQRDNEGYDSEPKGGSQEPATSEPGFDDDIPF